jgi:hypothetical protein
VNALRRRADQQHRLPAPFPRRRTRPMTGPGMVRVRGKRVGTSAVLSVSGDRGRLYIQFRGQFEGDDATGGAHRIAVALWFF